MGRMRIKKKGDVTPFAKTLPFRMVLVLVTGTGLIVCIFQALGTYGVEGFSPTALGWTVGAAIAGLLTFYNVERVKDAEVPAATLKRLKKR